MIKIEPEKDFVYFIFDNYVRDVMLTPPQADIVAEHLMAAAADAEKYQPKTLLAGDKWSCQARSFDGKVALRFIIPPHRNVTEIKKVPIPPQIAVKFAEIIRRQADFARDKLRLVLQNMRG